MTPLSQLRTLRRGNSSIAGKNSSPQPPYRSSVASPPGIGSSPTPAPDMSHSQRYVRIAQGLRLSLPSACRWLTPEDVDLVGGHPIAAGGDANIWEGMHDGRKVMLKSYCCCVSADVTHVVEKFRNEAHVWALLHNQNVNVIPLMGVYSTEAHPFGLVYQHMDGLDLRQHLRSEHVTDRLKLLAGIARSLYRIHSLGVIHGNLCTVNILVDKDGSPKIAGLGSASFLPHSAGWEGGTSGDRLFRGRAPEITWLEVPPGMNDSTYPTKASDMYAFGVMVWEVLTGRPPFSDMTEIAATYSMLSGARPPRPDNHKISERVWHVLGWRALETHVGWGCCQHFGNGARVHA